MITYDVKLPPSLDVILTTVPEIVTGDLLRQAVRRYVGKNRRSAVCGIRECGSFY